MGGEPASARAERSARGPVFAAAVMVALACVLWFTGKRQASQPQYQKTRVGVSIPDVVLRDQEGSAVHLPDALKADRPTVVNFLYTTCTTISPVLSAGYASFQRQLGAEAASVHLVSITIDPATDTPARLTEHLARYKARPGWDFFTGSREEVAAVMQAFNATMPTLESHYPVTFLRAAGATEWERLQGPISPSELMREYRRQTGSPAGDEKQP